MKDSDAALRSVMKAQQVQDIIFHRTVIMHPFRSECGKCHTPVRDLDAEKTCSGCGTTFVFMAVIYRTAESLEEMARRCQQDHPELVFVGFASGSGVARGSYVLSQPWPNTDYGY